MTKFVLLCAIIIALFAIVSATWVLNEPASNAELHPGSLVKFVFTTDAAITASSSFYVSLGSQFLTTDYLTGEGGDVLCTVGQTSVATLEIFSTTMFVEFFSPVTATSSVTCTVRAATGPTNVYTAQIGDGSSVTFTMGKPNASLDILDALINDKDSSTDVSIKVSGLIQNTLYGPLDFGYEYDQTTADNIAIYSWKLTTADFSPVVAPGIRLLRSKGSFWILTNGSPSSEGKFTITYPQSTYFNEDDVAKPYSVFVGFTFYGIISTPKFLGSVVPLPKIPMTAMVYGNSVAVVYVLSGSITEPNPKFKFALDGYSRSKVFNEYSTIGYAVVTEDTTEVFASLDIRRRSWEYDIIAPAGAFVTVTGAIVVLSDDFTPVDTFTNVRFKGSLGNFSASASMVLNGVVDSPVVIGSITNNVLDYSFTVSGDSSNIPLFFTGLIPYSIAVRISYETLGADEIASGDIRAYDAYVPECTSIDGQVTVNSPTQADIDAGYITVVVSGSLADAFSVHAITCKQKLHDGPKRSKLRVLLSSPSKSFLSSTQVMNWSTIITTSYDQQIVINAGIITDQVSFQAIITNVINAIKDDFGPNLTANNFQLYYRDGFVQHYASHTAGLDFNFETLLEVYSNAGSCLSFVFNRPQTGALNIADTSPVTKKYYLDKMKIVVSGSGSYDGLDTSAKFLDGSIASDFAASQSVQFGHGMGCLTSAQCIAGAHCTKNKCTPRSALTLAQQDEVEFTQVPEEDDWSSENSAFIIFNKFAFAIFAIVVSAFFF